VQWADYDGDGDEDLALTGVRADTVPLLLRNDIEGPARGRWLRVRALDARGRAIVPGAEVRVYAAGTRRLLGARLVDTGSGYNAQSAMPVHVGLGSAGRVDVEVTFVGRGGRVTRVVRNVRPGRVVNVRAR
jgi:hypothetical protein